VSNARLPASAGGLGLGRWGGWAAVVVTTGIAALVTVGGLTLVDHAALNILARHVGTHAAAGLGGIVLLASAIFVWPRAHGIGRWARRTLTAGLVVILIGQGLEAVGAFGYDPDDGYLVTSDPLAQVHAGGLMLFPPGVVVFLAGAVLSVSLWIRRQLRHAAVNRAR
jgi:hypothetical protein